ncbi:MAG: hypothetical protein ABEI27_09745 [Halobellus sp.]|uniref:hypothetical protein n=1 Tax=Halobellus sp. TaxID=1979212 RepID=UPI0035D52623
MVSHQSLRTTLLGRDVAVADAAIAVLYLLKFVGFPPAQVPPYLLIVAYDLVEVAVPLVAPYYPVAVPLFLYLVAVVGAGAARLASAKNSSSALSRTLGGVYLLVRVISLAFSAFVGGPIVAAADNPTPLAITGAAGLCFLGTAWQSLGRPTAGVSNRR